jgi:CheY-like chemotaxis protein
VANDNQFQIFVIAKSLKKLSFVEQIDTASNGQEALELVIKNEKEFSKKGQLAYDLIFLDLDMPIKDGFQACSGILNFFKDNKQKQLQALEAENFQWFEDFYKFYESMQKAKNDERLNPLMLRS